MSHTFFPLKIHDAHDLWYPSLSSYPKYSTNSIPSPNSPLNHLNQQARHAQSNLPIRTVLNTLRADEHLIAVRKANIASFGATWLKPPGVPRTLQGMLDERVEREEQEAAMQREIAMQEAQLAAEAQARDAEGMENDEEGLEEHDLDEDIPSADEENGEDGEDDEWFDDGDGEGQDSMGEEEEEELSGLYAEDDADDGMATHGGEEGVADLDDDIPEAGSYQHTDTEIEDESSINIYAGTVHSSLLLSSGARRLQVPVSPSSVLGSSPIAQRDNQRNNDGRAGRS